MTVTPLRRHDAKSPPAYRVARRRPRPTIPAARTAETPNALTVSFEVTLAGDARYRDALEIIDGLRRLSGRLDGVVLDVAPRHLDPATPVRATGPDARTAIDEVMAQETPGAIRVLPQARRVLQGGQPVPLTRIEFDLLQFLAEHPQHVFSRVQLLQHVWGYSHTGERTVDVHIRRIRAKLGDIELVTTIRGVGYRLADDVDIRVVRPIG